jgi:antitoxin (DNA-binding transcriptional repressor) of toxin-antitoxin stability system
MKTLTVTEARQRLGYWLKLAEEGEEIGVIQGASVFALRKVPIQAADYMETEYGLTKEEADQAAKRIRADARDTSDCISLDSLGSPAPARKAAGRILVGRHAGAGKSRGAHRTA